MVTIKEQRASSYDTKFSLEEKELKKNQSPRIAYGSSGQWACFPRPFNAVM